jgi:hypothetical protein
LEEYSFIDSESDEFKKDNNLPINTTTEYFDDKPEHINNYTISNNCFGTKQTEIKNISEISENRKYLFDNRTQLNNCTEKFQYSMPNLYNQGITDYNTKLTQSIDGNDQTINKIKINDNILRSIIDENLDNETEDEQEFMDELDNNTDSDSYSVDEEMIKRYYYCTKTD